MLHRTAALVFLLLVALPAAAWDTKETEEKGPGEVDKWLSLYLCQQSGQTTETCKGNEHEVIAQMALDQAVVNAPWRMGRREDFIGLDLNASIFRPELSDLRTMPENQDEDLPLEQRNLPSPAHFASIPDVGYTIYDWINKNRYCPPLPPGHKYEKYCHVFGLLHGAAFNSSHFGDQASESYKRLHATAVTLARRAAEMLENTRDDAEREAHREAIREAELLALAYEAYAQHFLADRWATGHMWNRWGAPEYNPGAYGDELSSAVATGLFTGILHGYESAVGRLVPDALSSPELPADITLSLRVPEWRHADSDRKLGGVGDYRFWDMLDGGFGKDYAFVGYTDLPLNVLGQYRQMMTCMRSGFGEVVANFGKNPAGGLGIDGVRLRPGVAGGPGNECFDFWVTNSAMKLGWGGTTDKLKSILNLDVVVRYVPTLTTNASASDMGLLNPLAVLKNIVLDRWSLGKIGVKIRWRSFWAPDGLDLARNNLGSYGSAEQAGSYPVASYLEPSDPFTLPEKDPRGRDLRSVFGLFNRAGARLYCTAPDTYLAPLRGATDDKERAACRLLAGRFYAGTWEKYSGPQAETASVDFARDQREVRPLCQVVGGWTAPDGDTDSIPYRLMPGYVPWTPATEFVNNTEFPPTSRPTQAYEEDRWGLSTRSIAAWCDQVPVIRPLTDDPEDLNRDIVARIRERDDEITLGGLNFGNGRGKVFIGISRLTAREVTDIRSWDDHRIVFSIADIFDTVDFDEENRSFLFVARAAPSDTRGLPGLNSVGRFVLLNDVDRPKVREITVTQDDRVLARYERPPELPDPGPFAKLENLPEPDTEVLPFRPVGPGTAEITIVFDQEMKQEPEATRVQIGDLRITGDWVSDTKWKGRFEIADGDFIRSIGGFREVKISAISAAGMELDASPDAGVQPFTEFSVFFGHIPNYLAEISVTAAGQAVYQARWQGGPDLEQAPNLTRRVLKDSERDLQVLVRATPPATGKGEISLVFAYPLETPPDIGIGPQMLDPQPDGNDERRWRATFTYESLGLDEGAQERVDILVAARNPAGQGLDADPRTVSLLDPEPAAVGGWAYYEDETGGNWSDTGGNDSWHYLAPPVDLSLLVLLDASGSMGDGTGRIESARDGIIEMVRQLPPDKAVELGAVVFSGCENFRIYPFSRDRESFIGFIAGIQPDSATDLAGAHYTGARMFLYDADPAAPEWRFATFTDGMETCGGNPAGAAAYLKNRIDRHTGIVTSARREAPPPKRPETAPEPVACNPDSWRTYKVSSDEHATLPTISMTEYWYLERALPDGSCFARLERKLYYVHYGSIRNAGSDNPARTLWRLNSQPSEESAEFGSSRQGKAALDRVRERAGRVRPDGLSTEAARQRISELVAAALEES